MSGINAADFDRRTFLHVAGMGAAASSLLYAPGVARPSGAQLERENALPYPPRGNFALKPIVAPHDASAAAMLDQRGYFGLERESLALYGCLRDASGDMYEVCRRIPGAHGVGRFNGLFLESNVGQDTLRMVPQAGMAAATSVGFHSTLQDDTVVWSSDPTAPGNPFKAKFNTTSCGWHEKGLFDLTGTLLGPGLQWYLPSADTGMFFVSHIFEVAGTVYDKPVRGMIGFDDIYLPQGVLLYQGGDPLTKHNNHRAWYTWGTRYTDGSYDAGHFMLGHDRQNFALLTNDKHHLTLDTDVTGTITQGPDHNWPASIHMMAAGERWEFLPNPEGRMPDLLGGNSQATTPQNEGRWQRVGDTRDPAVWFAWGEIAPGHGLVHENRFRW